MWEIKEIDGHPIIICANGERIAYLAIAPRQVEWERARLIAAAPELLEVCHDAITHLVNGNFTEAITLKRLRDAIGKTEGNIL